MSLILILPEPILTIHPPAGTSLELKGSHGLSLLTYPLQYKPTLSPGETWQLLAAGARGQLQFALTNRLPQGYFQAGVFTDC